MTSLNKAKVTGRKALGIFLLVIGFPIALYGSFMAVSVASTTDIADPFNIGRFIANMIIASFGGVMIYFGRMFYRKKERQKLAWGEFGTGDQDEEKDKSTS